MRNEKYQSWIEQYPNSIHRRCEQVTLEMADAFPELVRIRGFAYVIESPTKRQAHWWLITPTGEIVDPTARQWAAIIEYEPIDESRELTGMCPVCDDALYDGASFCAIGCACSASSELGSTRLIVQIDGLKYICKNGRVIEPGPPKGEVETEIGRRYPWRWSRCISFDPFA